MIKELPDIADELSVRGACGLGRFFCLFLDGSSDLSDEMHS